MPGLQFLNDFSCRISKPYLWSKPKPVRHILTNFKIFLSTHLSPPWRVCDLWSCKPLFTISSMLSFDSNFFTVLWMDCFRPESVGTVTHEEKENFAQIKKRLRVLLEHQVWSLTPNANKILYSKFEFKILISSKNIRIWKDTLESTSFSLHWTSTKMFSFLHLLSHIREGTFLAKNWAKKQKTNLWVTIPASYSRLSWPTSVSSTPSAGPREPSRLHSPF